MANGKIIDTFFLNELLEKEYMLFCEELSYYSVRVMSDVCAILSIFYDSFFLSTGDSEIEVRLSFLRGYKEYFFRVMMARLYASYEAGVIDMDLRFAGDLYLKILNEDYSIPLDREFTIRLGTYYNRLQQIERDYDLLSDIEQTARKIDPLYMNNNR